MHSFRIFYKNTTGQHSATVQAPDKKQALKRLALRLGPAKFAELKIVATIQTKEI